jgi:hypothetical protein
MGLTINFTLRAPAAIDAAGIANLVREMRETAFRFHHEGRIDRVGVVRAASAGMLGLSEYLIVKLAGDPHTSRGIEVPPEQGHVFYVTLGQGCEPLILGLCRYPTNVPDRAAGRNRRVRRTGWRISGSCKTQYASLHGWEHFRRCHTAAVDLLTAIRSTSLRVKISDEGGYWPGRDEASLRAMVERLNRLVAGMAGALRDASDEEGGTPVQSPIFAHPDFERIEAEGISKEGKAIGEAITQVRQLRQPGDQP